MSAGFKICVVGIWHLGSVVSACLADLGYRVIGVDKDPQRVKDLNKGVPPLFEPSLAELITKNLESKRLSYTTELDSALKGAKYVLITSDTHVDAKDEVDLSEIFKTSAELGKYLEDGLTLIVSSQVPVGTCEKMASIISSQRSSLSFGVACVPENLRLGQAIERFRHPEMIVIGSDSIATQANVERLFSVIQAPKLRVDLKTAEMIKHAINAYLATSISFINEVANLCDEVGADAVKVAEAMRLDSRISHRGPLRPGLGFSGGTLARDLRVLQKLGEKVGYRTHLINSVLKVNQQQNRIVVRKLRRIHGSLQNLTVGILGLTYKAGTSTLRRSMSLEMIRDLTDNGARVKAYDPKADLREVQIDSEFEFCSDPYAVASGCDALVFMTDWPEFKELDFSRIKLLMKKPIVIDAQNMLDTERMIRMGFVYLGVGRGV